MSRVEPQDWDKKKLLILAVITFFVLLALFGGIKLYRSKYQKPLVQGASTSADIPKINISEEFRQSVDDIRHNVKNLNAVDVATSSPQVQKIINDIKSLQDLPKNQAKQFCERICSGI